MIWPRARRNLMGNFLITLLMFFATIVVMYFVMEYLSEIDKEDR